MVTLNDSTSVNLSLTGADKDLFEIIGDGLFLKKDVVLDTETNPDLDISVSVDDPTEGATPDDTDSLLIFVTDVNEAPIITSLPDVGAAKGETTVTTVTATDEDLPSQSLTYEITGGANQGLFTIIKNTGELSFITAPTAADTFTVEVTVSDNASPPLTDTQELIISVSNPPVVSGTFTGSVTEDGTLIAS
ncbi:unnamed protein product, partial [marine sediment metagenome]